LGFFTGFGVTIVIPLRATFFWLADEGGVGVLKGAAAGLALGARSLAAGDLGLTVFAGELDRPFPEPADLVRVAPRLVGTLALVVIAQRRSGNDSLSNPGLRGR
jgi:hypothetical protein